MRNVISSLLQTTKRVSQDVSSQKGQIARFARESGVDQPRTNIQYTQAKMPIEVEGVKSGSYESSLSSGSIDENFLRGVVGDLDPDIDTDAVSVQLALEDMVNSVVYEGDVPSRLGPMRVERVSRGKKPDKKITMYREPTADDLSVALSNQYGVQRIRPVEPHMDYPHLRTYVEIDGPNEVKQRGYVIGEEEGKYIIGLDGYRAKVKLFNIYKILFKDPVRGLESVEIQEDLLDYMDIRDSKLDENKELYERLSSSLRRLTRGNKLLVEVTNSEDHAWRKPLEQPYLPHADGDYYILATLFAPFNHQMLGHFFTHGYWGGQQKLEDLEVLVKYDDKIVKLDRSEFTITQGQHMDMVNRQFNQDRDEEIQNVYGAIERAIRQEDNSVRNAITELNRDPVFATNADLTMGQLRGLQFESQVPEYERQRAFERAEGYVGGGSKLKDCCDKNIKTRRKCRRKDGKTFKLPRKHSRDKCLSKKKKGFSMESSCAPYKYCDQSGGGLVYSTLPYHLRSYISDDWSKSSDSNKKLMYLDPHRRLFKDDGPDGAGQWYVKYGNEHKNFDYIIQGEEETCRLPHKGNRKKLKKWADDRKMTKTKYAQKNNIKDDEIYRNVTTKADLFDFYKCKNDDEYLDIQCNNGKLTNTKCVRSNKSGGGKTKKKKKKERDLTLKKSKGRKKQSKAKRKKALEKAIQYKLAEMVIEDRRKEWIPEPPIYAEQLSTTESFNEDDLNYEDYLNEVSFNPEQRRKALEGVSVDKEKGKLDDLEDMFRDIRLNRRNQNFLEIQGQLNKLNIK